MVTGLLCIAPNLCCHPRPAAPAQCSHPAVWQVCPGHISARPSGGLRGKDNYWRKWGWRNGICPNRLSHVVHTLTCKWVSSQTYLIRAYLRSTREACQWVGESYVSLSHIQSEISHFKGLCFSAVGNRTPVSHTLAGYLNHEASERHGLYLLMGLPTCIKWLIGLRIINASK